MAKELDDLGRLLWVDSFVRRDSGNEATALVVQTAAALGRSVVVLLSRSHFYGAGSLLRQLIEVEYLLHEFGRDPVMRIKWLEEPHETRSHTFAPKALRKRANGTFSAKQYGTHCRMGGHPSPDARSLLPDHTAPYNVEVMLWEDLGEHLVGVWQRLDPLLPGTGLPEDHVRRLRARVIRLMKAKHDTVPPTVRTLRAAT